MSYLRIAIALLVAVVWAIVVLGSYFQHRSPPPEVSGVMLAVVTWLMGAEIRRAVKKRLRNGDDA